MNVLSISLIKNAFGHARLWSACCVRHRIELIGFHEYAQLHPSPSVPPVSISACACLCACTRFAVSVQHQTHDAHKLPL